MHNAWIFRRFERSVVLLIAQTRKQLHDGLLRWFFESAPGDVFRLGQDFFSFGHLDSLISFTSLDELTLNRIQPFLHRNEPQ